MRDRHGSRGRKGRLRGVNVKAGRGAEREKRSESCGALGLARTVLGTASVIYRKRGPEKVKGRMVVSMVTATVDMACKECGVVRSLDEICRSMCQPTEAAQRKKRAARH